MNTKLTKNWTWRLMLLSLFTLGACGQQTVLPPVTAGYGVGYAGNCASSVGGGQPISSSALNATLTDNNSSVVGSISLYLYFTTQYNAGDSTSSIVGSGSLSFTNASYLYGSYANYGGAATQTSFCISSQDPTGGGLITGVFSQADASLAIAMKGLVNLPSINPYTGAPTGSASSQPITVSIGYDCATTLSGTSRFQGCVRLDMGTGSAAVLWAN